MIGQFRVVIFVVLFLYQEVITDYIALSLSDYSNWCDMAFKIQINIDSVKKSKNHPRFHTESIYRDITPIFQFQIYSELY